MGEESEGAGVLAVDLDRPVAPGRRRVQELKVRALRCPCGQRMEAGNDGALRALLRDHIEREHPYTEPPTNEWVRDLVSSAVYGLEYVPVGPRDSLEEEGFGPDPY